MTSAQCLCDQQTVVELHLHASSGYPINIVSKPATGYTVRVSATHLPTEDSQAPVNNHVQLKVLAGHDCITLSGDNHNRVYQENDFFIYSTSTTNLSSLIFKIDIYDKTNAIIGHGFVSASQIKGSAGSLIVTIFNDSLSYTGHITVSYLVIHPWSHPLNVSQCDEPRRSRAIHGMKADGQYYYSGHRGAGESFKETSPSIYPENTISAFKAASKVEVDFVEMDVQVSKDKVPVVFHDGTVKLHIQGNSSPSIIEVPVKDLTLEQMQSCKVAGVKDHKAHLKAKQDGSENIELDFKLFPTLKEVFDHVPGQTGLLLEVKYPLADVEGKSVDSECMDHNEFVDAILQVVYENAKDRKIILASFDPNICCMLQLKQSKFPVYIITQDDNTIWVPYLDLRTRHIDSAIALSKAYSLDGIHTFSQPLIQSPERIDKVMDAGLILSVWGSPNEDAETRRWLHDRGVQCIQVDDVFEATKSTNISVTVNPVS